MITAQELNNSPVCAKPGQAHRYIVMFSLIAALVLSWVFYNTDILNASAFVHLKYISTAERDQQTKNLMEMLAEDKFYDDFKEIPVCDLEMDFIEFQQKHVRNSLPCIFAGATAKWPAFTKWTDEYLKKTVGEETVTIERTTQDKVFVHFKKDWARVPMKFSEFLDNYDNPDREYNYYFAEQKILEQLRDDVIEPIQAMNWDLKHLNYWQSKGGTESLAHTDGFENFLCQVDGFKDLKIAPPTQRLYIKTKDEVPNYTLMDFYDVEKTAEEYPDFRKAKIFTLRLNAGDCFYMPANWWHHVRSSTQRNLAINFWYTTFSR
eukprot:CAMPEP_0115000034 /NCGR_PEP_ID=MMETSP0216-20121206/16510_1 /TAXON_ID=223996 /ORGANISM="Protocruzia adherens, Strain Boccale" /LENGTH=319 /DNA_ID=CAMNT_0002365041 /DNA_START=89 /DNA_END=1044 /DNA_ORIENTATION=-